MVGSWPKSQGLAEAASQRRVGGSSQSRTVDSCSSGRSAAWMTGSRPESRGLTEAASQRRVGGLRQSRTVDPRSPGRSGQKKRVVRGRGRAVEGNDGGALASRRPQ